MTTPDHAGRVPLHCPHCAADPEVVETAVDGVYAVCCTNRDCIRSHVQPYGREAAIAAWNVRCPVTTPDHAATIARLEARAQKAENAGWAMSKSYEGACARADEQRARADAAEKERDACAAAFRKLIGFGIRTGPGDRTLGLDDITAAMSRLAAAEKEASERDRAYQAIEESHMKLEARVHAYSEAMRDRSMVLCEKHRIGYSPRHGCSDCRAEKAEEAFEVIKEVDMHEIRELNRLLAAAEARGGEMERVREAAQLVIDVWQGNGGRRDEPYYKGPILTLAPGYAVLELLDAALRSAGGRGAGG